MGTFALHSQTGALGEEIGCRYLRRKGYVILAQNYCNTSGRRLGEIDIVAQNGKTIVFVEVKTRLGRADDTAVPIPEENVTRDKLRKLERVAVHYLHTQHKQSSPYHFDVLAVLYDSQTKKAWVRHLEHVF
ncbi:MAG: YraN family protein [Minisyncoccota bacterium]